MTKQEKEKIEKKQKIKSIIFKILHFIGYLSTLVLILFGVGLGVSSCQNKKQDHTTSQQINAFKKGVLYAPNQNVSLNRIAYSYNDFLNYDYLLSVAEDIYSYSQGNPVVGSNSFYFTGYFFSPSSSSSQYLDTLLVTNSNGLYTIRFSYDASRYLELKQSITQTTNNGTISTFNMLFRNSGTDYNVRANPSYQFLSLTYTNLPVEVKNAFLNNLSIFEGGYTEEDITNAYNEGYDEGVDHGIEIATDPVSSYYQEIYSEGYESGYDEGFSDGLVAPTRVPTTTYLTMSNNFDWRSLFTNNVDNVTGLFYSAEDLITQYNNALILEGLTFKCNDITYNQIYIPFMQLGSGLPVIVADSQDVLNLGYETLSKTTNDLYGENYDKYYALLGVYYRFYDEETDTITRTDLVYNTYESKTSNNVSSTGIINVNDYRNPSWVNEYYRFLDIVDNDSTKVQTPNFGSTLTTYEIISNGGFTTLKNVNNIDPFSLMSKAFAGMASIFSIAILPGITLGVLIFMPLIVAVVIAIIKLIKKG